MSSGEDCDLQIDVGKVEENPKKKEKKQQRGSGSREGGGGGGGGQGDAWKPGDLVWAKVSGFNHWPGKVFDVQDALVPDWLQEPPKPTYILVRFFGTYDMQWVSSRSTESYQKGLKKKFHSKSRSKAFQKAVKEVKECVASGVTPEGLTAKVPAKVPEQEKGGGGRGRRKRKGGEEEKGDEGEEGGKEEGGDNQKTRKEDSSEQQASDEPPAKSSTKKGKRRAASSTADHSSSPVKKSKLNSSENGAPTKAQEEKEVDTRPQQ